MTITNTGASNARFYLERSLQFKTNSMSRISSGRRIVSASDDAAGLSVATKMRAQIEGTRQASQNSSNAISLVKTAETSSAEIANILNRMRELAIQVKNGTYSGADRAKAQAEVEELRRELNKIAMHTNFNGSKLLDGSFDRDMLVGHSGSETINVDIGDFTSSNLGKGSVAELGSENNHPNIAVTNLSVQEGDVVTIDRSVLGMSALSPAVGGTYSLSGTNADQFTIDSSTGNITAVTALDYESPTGGTLRNSTTYRFDVNYTVGGTKYIEEVTLELTDGGSEAQTGSDITIQLSESSSISINQAGSKVISENFQSFINADTGGSGAFSLSGMDAGDFSIDANGVITAPGGLDFDAPTGGAADDSNTYIFDINYTNSNGDTFNETVTLSITDMDNPNLDTGNPTWFTNGAVAPAGTPYSKPRGNYFLSVDNGSISLAYTTGLVAPYGYSTTEWNGSTQIGISGSPADLSAALASLVYTGSGGTVSKTATHYWHTYSPVTDDIYELLWGDYDAAGASSASSISHYGFTASLATVDSAEENAWINNFLIDAYARDPRTATYYGVASTYDTWINGTDSATEGTWVYDDGPEDGNVFWIGGISGSAQNGYYSNWASGNPDNSGNQDYVQIIVDSSDSSTSGQWYDQPESNTANALIEYNVSGRTSYYDFIEIPSSPLFTSSVQVNSSATQSSTSVVVGDFSQSLDDLSLTNSGTITSAIGILDQALQQTSELRAYLGAKTNQLEASYSSLIAQTMYVGLAKGRIMDADMASESTRLALANMLSKTSADMLLRAQTAQKENLLSIIEQT
ncbi:flagellin [Alphaproteobacteria bacterium]|nr:flagellin [Alphaproteobacteria bacterium]